LWLRDLDWRYLALATLLLGATANVKNEGLLLVVAVLVAAALVLAAGRAWRLLIPLGLGFLGVLVAVAPWRLWVGGHDIKINLPIGKGLDPSYLSDRSDRIVPSFKALYPMLESGGLAYVVPLAVVLVLLALATRGLRRVAAFYLLAGLGTLVSVIWAFVITTDSLAYQISTSASRVIMGVTAVSLAALLQLGGLLDGDRERDPAQG
jgi:4-amino-4-deoxy-L-arabinose transferase-like glycosyltransferase